MQENSTFIMRTAVNGTKKVVTGAVTLLYINQGQAEVYAFGRQYSAGYGSVFMLFDGEFCEVSSRSAIITTLNFDRKILSADTLRLAFDIQNRAVALMDEGVERFTDYITALSGTSRLKELENTVTDKLLYCLLAEVKCAIKLGYSLPEEPLSKAVYFMTENTLSAKKLSDIAEFAGVTVNYLCALFKGKTGVSCNKYIKRLKLRYAEFLLLTTTLSVKEVSDKCKYLSFSHFMSDFKEELSLTPNAYKKLYE